MSGDERRHVTSAQVRLQLRLALAFLVASVASAGVSKGVVRAQAPGVSGPTIGVEELRPGMRGIGYTVVRGTTPEQFSVEVIGVSGILS